MLNRIIIFSMIISIVGHASVWAFDGHPEETAGHRSIASDTWQATDEDDNHPACDHCCHSSLHTLALCPAHAGTVDTNAVTGDTPYRHTFYNLSTSPPVHPPKT